MKNLYLLLLVASCFGSVDGSEASRSSKIVSDRQLRLCLDCDGRLMDILGSSASLCASCLKLVSLNTRVTITLNKVHTPRGSTHETRSLSGPAHLFLPSTSSSSSSSNREAAQLSPPRLDDPASDNEDQGVSSSTRSSSRKRKRDSSTASEDTSPGTKKKKKKR